MARIMVGGCALVAASGYALGEPGDTVELWRTKTGDTRVLDVLDAASGVLPGGLVTVDTDGLVPLVQPEVGAASACFASVGGGPRQVLLALAPNPAPIEDYLAGAVVRGQTGRKYVALGAVIRNDGAGFYALDDAGHRASWIDSIVTTATYIRVNYAAAAATKAVTFIAANDEKFAREGLFLGTSVNLASTDIFIYRQAQPIADYVYYDGTNWATSKDRFTFGPTAFNTSTGVLTLGHAPITSSETVAASATARGARFGVTVEACTTTTTQIAFRTASATGPNYFPAALTPDVNMKAYVQVGGGFQVSVNPQDLTTTTYPGSNLWLIGLMEVA